MDSPQRLLASIDMGTNSFKLLLVRAHPNGRFLALDHLKDSVVLGRGCTPLDHSISPESQHRAISALRSFSHFLHSHRVHETRVVATSAVREAPNRAEFLSRVREELGFEVDVLSGEEEARLIYLGVLQFLPIYEKTVLTVDIGGGSTEFVVGQKGNVFLATSLKLGHVSLTESFVRNGEIQNLRRHIRTVLRESRLIEKVREFGFEIAVGSSGTIRSIERAIFLGSSGDLMNTEFEREWRFSREELSSVVEKLCGLDLVDVGGLRRLGVSKRRAEFIVAGAVLLLEIFEALDIGEMEVSGYALGEGVVSEMIARGCTDYDRNTNARWQSVVGLAMRFDGDNRMKSAVRCVRIAKEIFSGIRRCDELVDCRNKSTECLDEKDFEYVEAAILLHNIGLLICKKGYHKFSYRIIKNASLHGYSSEEIEIIALLARYHRKKFPRCNHASLQEFSKEVKLKFRALCAIVRISFALQQCQCMTFEGLEVLHSHEGFKLVLGLKDLLLLSHSEQLTSAVAEAELKPELEHFEEVFQQKLSVAVP